MSGICPICGTNSTLTQCSNHLGYCHRIECPRCGEYTIADDATRTIEDAFKMDERSILIYARSDGASVRNDRNEVYVEFAKKSLTKGMDEPRSIISHVLRKSANKNQLDHANFANILKNNSLPAPAEQANNLILFLGENLSSPGDVFKVPGGNEVEKTKSICGLLGIKIGKEWPDLCFIITSLGEQGIINVNYQSGAGAGIITSGGKQIPESISLTFLGWQKYEELKHSAKGSRKAFMAMEFADPNKTGKDYFFQNDLLGAYLVPAAKQTEYDLANPLLVDPKAGNIHARMEAEIRSSRFVVAEITDGNNGAYWEAGFAKGLGKPVIYMCKKGVTPHFDVGSDYIIFWDKDKPEDAAAQLKAIIRATLFSEAKMTDGA